MAEKELVKALLFTVATKESKYLGENLTKDVEYFCNENYKIQRNLKIQGENNQEDDINLHGTTRDLGEIQQS